ncbi:MAG TPA: hypothetical protein VK892_12620 [Pyrinomonadaceae bacterium]|nr:hypothetical protein [Pyrinomonadaceae bacterium]
MTKKLLLFVLLFCLFILTASAQVGKSKKLSTPPPPCGIKLLDGYVHVPLRGIDSWVGRIKKEGRLTITYDIGYLAGEYVNHCLWDNSCLWYKEQQFNGGLVKIALGSNEAIYATFPKTYANFYAEVKTQEDIAEFLLIIMTYDETQECENKI